MIWAYPEHPSVAPGDVLTLHVSSKLPYFTVDAYRQGAEFTKVGPLGEERLRAFDVPAGPPDRDWGWPAYQFRIPSDWKSGVYVAILTASTQNGECEQPDPSTPDGSWGKALFVVRAAEPCASILYKVPWYTYHAYNASGGGSLYAQATWAQPGGYKVTTRRPGGGTGGIIMTSDGPDFHAPGTRRQCFAHWDAPFISWLERSGYEADYCTDLDLDAADGLLRGYRLVLSVGHDEYWSRGVRQAIETFIGSGGNVAFFSGNISGWRVSVVDDDTALTCAKAPPSGEDISRWEWDQWHAADPENRVTGVSYYGGGAGWYDGARPARGYTVQHAGHWVFSGTGVTDGEVIGASAERPLVGYEADGAICRWWHGVPVPTGEDETPESFAVLGTAQLLEEGWSTRGRPAMATMGVYTSDAGGVVFQGATTDWVLALEVDPLVERITRNVIGRLSLRALPVRGPLPARGGRCLTVAGGQATYAAGVGVLPAGEPAELRFEWRSSTGGAWLTTDPVLTIDVPEQPQLLTVSVTVFAGDDAAAFGTNSHLTLTHEEGLGFELCTLLRELVVPADPSAPLAGPTVDPLAASRELTAANLPWVQQRADRIAAIAKELMECRRRAGSRDGAYFAMVEKMCGEVDPTQAPAPACEHPT